MRAYLVVVLAACGGNEELTCEMLAEPTNCWAEAAAGFAACLPPNTTIGTFNANRQSCDFPNGAQVLFDDPLPNDTFSLTSFGFFVQKDGASCGHFLDTFSNRMEVNEDVVSELHGGGEFHLHCGGTTYESDFQRLFECPTVAPTDGFDVTDNSVTFTMVSAVTSGPLFTCQK